MGIICLCRDKNIFRSWASQAINSYWYFLLIWVSFSSKVGFKLMLVHGWLYQAECLSCAWAVKEIRRRRALLDCCLYLLQPPCCTSFHKLIRFCLESIFRFTDGCSRNTELFWLETSLLPFEVICVTKWHPGLCCRLPTWYIWSHLCSTWAHYILCHLVIKWSIPKSFFIASCLGKNCES